MARETASVLVGSVYTIQPCTLSRHLMQSHICRVHACLAVTCHDWDLLRATAVTWGGMDTEIRVSTKR